MELTYVKESSKKTNWSDTVWYFIGAAVAMLSHISSAF